MRELATIHLGTLGAQLKHSLRHVFEVALVPLGLFYLLLTLTGMTGGLFAAMGWGLAAIGWRLVWRAPIPAVLAVSVATLGVRTLIGYLSGSIFLYFLQPSLSNFLLAFVLLVTVPLNRPLLARLANDFCAFPPTVNNHPAVQRFFKRVSLLWAAVFLATGVATLWTLAWSTLEHFLLVTTVGKASLVVLAAAVSLLWFRRSLRGHGIRLRFSRMSQPGVA